MTNGIGVALATLAIALGCASGPTPAAHAPDANAADEIGLRAQLVPSGDLGTGFSMRQRLRFRAQERGGSFEAVVQLDCGELLVVGLTPFGTRAFSIRQRGLDSEFDWALDEPWPFSPARILLDVHRSFLYPLADPPLADGVHERRFREVDVQERWQGGRLVERRIDERAGERVDRWVARYDGGLGPGGDPWPTLTQVESGAFGYSLEITTLARAPLACAP